MSFVSVAPEVVATAASDLARIGSSIDAVNAAAAGATTTVLAAGADEVSVAIAALFGTHAQEYQAISTRISALNERFVALLTAGSNSYAASESASVSWLQAVEQDVLGLVNAPSQYWFGRPLIGNGADGVAGTGVTTSTPGTTITDQSRIATGPTVLTIRARPPGTTITEQQPTVAAVLAGPRGPVGAVADQRAPQQRLGGRIYQVV